MTRHADHRERAETSIPSRREVLRGGVGVAAGLAAGAGAALVPQAARAQIAGVGVAQGTLPGRTAPHTLEGTSSDATPRRKQGVDVHAHYYPQAYLDVLAEGKAFGGNYESGPRGYMLTAPGFSGGPFPAKFTDLTLRLADMDAQGVRVHALSLTRPMPYFGRPDYAARLARAFNDAANAAHLQYPDRFVGLAALPMSDRDAAIDELNRSAKLPGIRGVYLGCNIEGRDFSDPEFLPVFQRMEALDLPLFLHPNGAVGGKRFDPYYLANILGNPFDTTIAACHLIYGGVMDKCPKLEICLPHAGGAMPMLIGRMDHGYAVRPDVPALPRPPSEYLRRFTYDTIGHDARVVRFLISEVGADRVMLGSDYCLDMGYLKPVQDLDVLNLPPRDRDAILFGTASRMLKLSA
jgi:aminocarboxymuconate-semialdehyde decarboxylase